MEKLYNKDGDEATEEQRVISMRKETLMTFKAIAKSYAKEKFDGVEPSYSSHGEGFYGLYNEYNSLYLEKLDDLKSCYKSIEDEGNAE